METWQIKTIAYKLTLVLLAVGFLLSAIFYLNSRWEKIRDIRRQADAGSIVKALDYYNVQFGSYPENTDDDGDGWDKSNDGADRKFLEPLNKVGLLPALAFDPKNDESHYYRYQKFNAGEFGCTRPYAVFQVANFEEVKDLGRGECPEINWTIFAPNGYTWFSLE